MVAVPGLEPGFFGYEPNAFPLDDTAMEPSQRVELWSLPYQGSALPLSYEGMRRAGTGPGPKRAGRPVQCLAISPRLRGRPDKMVAQPGFEPGTPGYEPGKIPFLHRAMVGREGVEPPKSTDG